MKKNILAVLDTATPEQLDNGMSWYARARDIAGEFPSMVHGAGIIAALSPMLSWDRNIVLARQAFEKGIASGCLGSSCAKANLILQGHDPRTVLGGDKVKSFWHNIAFVDSDRVTIDRHAYDIAMGKRNTENDRPALKGRRYEEFAHAYRLAAKARDMHPYQLQAVTWEVWRSQYAWKK